VTLLERLELRLVGAPPLQPCATIIAFGVVIVSARRSWSSDGIVNFIFLAADST
jgi:hypothetical protein